MERELAAARELATL
jgi:hypothetical protein